MSDVDSTDGDLEGLSPLELDAARGELPAWARATPARREHMARVAALMEEWAHAIGLGEREALRWAAAAWLHDSLRDADPGDLSRDVTSQERRLPPELLHGPAVAARLDGRVDPRVVTAIRYHTIGSARLDELGRALYLADFLEPGRDFANEWRADLRRRMPAERDAVLIEVVAARIRHLLDKRLPIRRETADFWSTLVSAELL